jgi:hypothetical protein
MADFSLTINGYGHFGSMKYLSSRLLWTFERGVTPPKFLVPIGSPLQISSGYTSEAIHSIDKQERRRQNRAVVTTHPDLYAAASFYQHELILSHSISKAYESYDPMVGSLLAIDRISTATHRICHAGAHQSLVAAFPQHANSSALTLLSMPVRSCYFPHDPSGELFDVMLPDGESTSLQGPGAAIRQVTFSTLNSRPRPDGSMRWPYELQRLAVRFASKTVILKPKRLPNMKRIQHRNSPSTTCFGSIDFETSLEIDFDATPFSDHTHVSFSPFDPTNFAIIDMRGCWAIYEYDPHRLDYSARELRKRQTSHVGSLLHGRDDAGDRDSISEEEDGASSPGTSSCLQDGWTRVYWTGHHDMIVAASRKRLCFFDTATDVSSDFTTHDPGEHGWNIDLVALGQLNENLFALTSSRLLWLLVSGKTAKLVTSTRHFRNPLDLGMKLRVLIDGNGMHNRTTCSLLCER